MNASIVLGSIIALFLIGLLLKSSWEYFWKDLIIILVLAFVVKSCTNHMPEGKNLNYCVCEKEKK